MIYNLILNGRLSSFATVRVKLAVKKGDEIIFKEVLYRIIDIDDCDLIVTAR